MEKEEEKKFATKKQRAYIKALKRDLGDNSATVDENLTIEKASQLIEKLQGKAEKISKGVAKNKGTKVNDARLGMVMKECFRRWNTLGRSGIYEERRDRFKDLVRNTYLLFSEIADEIDRGVCVNSRPKPQDK
jgi:hypothetical protein